MGRARVRGMASGRERRGGAPHAASSPPLRARRTCRLPPPELRVGDQRVAVHRHLQNAVGLVGVVERERHAQARPLAAPELPGPAPEGDARLVVALCAGVHLGALAVGELGAEVGALLALRHVQVGLAHAAGAPHQTHRKALVRVHAAAAPAPALGAARHPRELATCRSTSSQGVRGAKSWQRGHGGGGRRAAGGAGCSPLTKSKSWGK